jgi:hypothetical protein
MVGAVGRGRVASCRVWRELELGLHLRVEQHQGHAVSHRQRLDMCSCQKSQIMGLCLRELLDFWYSLKPLAYWACCCCSC